MQGLTPVEFGKLPALQLQAADGARAIVSFFGAHLVSWRPAGADERLFCSSRSALDGGKAIRGGMPIIFPQFAERGTGMRHGFARVTPWRRLADGMEQESGACWLELGLDQTDLSEAARAGWPHPFALRLRFAVHADGLQVALRVQNTGHAGFSFAAALHTYFLIDDLAQITIQGLQGKRFFDLAGAPEQTGVQEETLLTCQDKIDRRYQQVAGEVLLADGGDRTDRAKRATVGLRQSGFADAVVWNPGAADATALSDMDDVEYRRFICIEPALIEPFLLAPGAEWLGRHWLRHGGRHHADSPVDRKGGVVHHLLAD